MNRNILVTLVLVCGVFVCANAQGGRVALSGVVRDAGNGESMMGVYVILSELSNPQNVQGCVTNQAGYYSISVTPGTYKLTVNFMGYRTLEDTLTLTKSQQRRFEMEPVAISGEEVVIQGERGNVNVTGGDVGRMELEHRLSRLPLQMLCHVHLYRKRTKHLFLAFA